MGKLAHLSSNYEDLAKQIFEGGRGQYCCRQEVFVN